MGVQDWNLSGQGRDVGPIALSDAHILAIKAGFVFTDNQGVPAQKRANLQGTLSVFIEANTQKNDTCPISLLHSIYVLILY